LTHTGACATSRCSRCKYLSSEALRQEIEEGLNVIENWNSATQYLFKEDLQGLANRLGLEIRVAHYPPYCSKHNPIEHQVFPHLTRACQGVIFHTVDIARQFIERTHTTTGLQVTVRMLDTVYQPGRKYTADFKQNLKIVFDDYLPKWNYRAVPEFL
jgi:hypothetical protein